MGKKNRQLPSEWRRERARKEQLLQQAAAEARLNKAVRWYDVVRVTGFGDNPLGMSHSFENCQLVIADNVQDYLEENQNESLFKDFEFVISPIFQKLCVEMRYSATGATWLFFVQYRSDENGHLMDVFLGYYHPEWTVDMVCCPVMATLAVGTDGKWRAGSTMNCFPVVDDISDSQMWSAATLLSEAINALLFTLTLMHCRNTQLLDREPDPHLSRKYEKRYGVPMTRYKVLKVTSMRKWRADAGSAEPDTDTLPKSLHIVRGHFKDYRHGNGLWGRYRDIFWWDAHVRGDEKRGIVAKDYEVEPEGD